jgi:hypothetical protein
MRQYVRQIIGLVISPILRATGFRFSKDYRHGVTLYHAFIYRWVDTVGANLRADGFVQPLIIR